MSPEAYRFAPISSRGFDGVDMKSFHKEQHQQEGDQETPRYVSSLGKNAYALAFGSADLTKILLFSNSGQQKHQPMSPQGDAASYFSKKVNNPEESGSLPVSPQGGNKGDFMVPRDFQIKTAYVRKRRNTTNKDADA